MTAKEYLMQYRKSMNRINELTVHIEELRAICNKITPKYGTGGGTTAASDKLGAAVAKLVDAEDDAVMEITQLRQTLTAVQKVISSVQNDRYRNLLYRRYICGNTWEQIAVSMHYTYRNITYLHGKALLAAEKIISKQKP
ncbi:MAG: hypothetical protein MJZ17_11240 [Bacteroidales bacterium]|nr:hypothetical protein [Bacteroidales bacterium]